MQKSEELSVAEFFRLGNEAAILSAALAAGKVEFSEGAERATQGDPTKDEDQPS